jgi:hypothetical protein
MEFAGASYFTVKNSIIKYERYLLKELGFCVHVKHPHKMIMSILQVLGKGEQELVQKSWNFINDSLRTSVLLRYPPEVVACGCIFLAARSLKVPLPENPGWWQMFDATYSELEDIALDILEMYDRPKRNVEEVEKELNALKDTLQKTTDKEPVVRSASVPVSAETSPKVSPKVSPVGNKDLGSDGMSSATEDDSSQKHTLKIPSRTTSRGVSPLVKSHLSRQDTANSIAGGGGRERSPSRSSLSSSSEERYHPVISPIRITPPREQEDRKSHDRHHNGRLHREDSRDSHRSKHRSKYHHRDRERRHNRSRSRSRSRDRSRRHRVH